MIPYGEKTSFTRKIDDKLFESSVIPYGEKTTTTNKH